jgi:hypothetical protein
LVSLDRLSKLAQIVKGVALILKRFSLITIRHSRTGDDIRFLFSYWAYVALFRATSTGLEGFGCRFIIHRGCTTHKVTNSGGSFEDNRCATHDVLALNAYPTRQCPAAENKQQFGTEAML